MSLTQCCHIQGNVHFIIDTLVYPYTTVITQITLLQFIPLSSHLNIFISPSPYFHICSPLSTHLGILIPLSQHLSIFVSLFRFLYSTVAIFIYLYSTVTTLAFLFNCSHKQMTITLRKRRPMCFKFHVSFLHFTITFLLLHELITNLLHYADFGDFIPLSLIL